MIKKRIRPTIRQREKEEEVEDPETEIEEENTAKLTPDELLALRRLKRGRQGIDAAKLIKGDLSKRKRKDNESESKGGLNVSSRPPENDEEAKARRAVRANNFTQQTNVLDVDKHMLEYIEENIRKRRGELEIPKESEGPRDPFEELYRLNRYSSRKEEKEEGNVTNSLAMLTAIPEVDLGIDTRLKNIEETEKAKRLVAEDQKAGNNKLHVPKDEEHLIATRFYRAISTEQADAKALRKAKQEAMGFSPDSEAARRPPSQASESRARNATDEIVMERFKKRMRK